MKKLLVTILILGIIGGGGWLAYRYLFVPKDQRACERLAELCGSEKPTGETIEQCTKAMSKLKEVAGEKSVDGASDCIAKADSCIKATGCVFGAGIGAMGEFLKGVKEAVEKSLKKDD